QIRGVLDDQLLAELPQQTNGVRMIHHFSRDGRFVPVLYRNGVLELWDLTRRQSVLSARPQDMLPLGWDFSADSRRFAVVDAKGAMLLYELPSGKLLRAEPPRAPWLRPAFSPDGSRIAICSPERTAVAIIDAADGKTLGQ